jgi:hypothetical protein
MIKKNRVSNQEGIEEGTNEDRAGARQAQMLKKYTSRNISCLKRVNFRNW